MSDLVRWVPRFLLGESEAIRRLAAWRPTLGVGAVLVLTAAVAREYDREYLVERPELLLLPFAASLGVAALTYGSLRLFALRGPPEHARGRFRVYLGLFWLTAPLAWLYAVPVERFLAPVPAALFNVCLLAAVAIWRVWLIARVSTVLFGAGFRRALGAILLPSSLLVLVLSFASQISLVGVMGGISLAPETRILVNAAHVAFLGSIAAGVASLVLLGAAKAVPTTAVPPASPSRFPVLPLAVLLLLWLGIAAYPQVEVRRHARVDAFLADERYRETLDLLSASEPRDFAPTRRIAPDPQRNGSGSWRHLPGLLAAMDGSEARWVRDLYLSYLGIQIGPEHHRPPMESATIYAQALARLPEGAAFVGEHRADLERIASAHATNGAQREQRPAEYRLLLEAYRQLGIDLPQSGD
jgi:hypothetical protein